MLRVGLIGCGVIGRVHAQGWAKLNDRAKVIAVVDSVEQNARQAAAIVGAGRIYADYREVLQSGEVDAVDICLPHHLHAQSVKAAAGSGQHILCQKPLCASEQEADAMAQAVRQAGVTMMCAHHQLFDPPVQRAREMIDAGELGKVYLVRTMACSRVTETSASSWAWRIERARLGEGELMDNGFHSTYLLLYMAGSPPTEVQAMTANFRLSVLSPSEDSAQVMVRFANGSMGQLLTSWAFELPDGGFQFQVIGEKGQLTGRGNVLQHKPNGGWNPARLELPPVNNFDAMIEHFVECIETGNKPRQTVEDGALAVRFVLAAYRSVKTGRKVRLG